MTPLVSIVTSHFKRPELLEKTLVSIASQKVPFLYEIVVVNDDQPHRPLEALCRRFKGFGVNIRLLNTYRTRPFRNQSYTLNCGVKAANGLYIILQSSEVMHTGQVIEGLVDSMMHSVRPYHCARCVSLLPEDEQWINDHIGEIAKSNEILKVFDYPSRGEYVGPTNKRNFFFLAGIKKEDFLSIGGLEEKFDKPGYDDNFFAFTTMINGLDCQILDKVSWFGLHQHHDRPLDQSGYGQSLVEMEALNARLQYNITQLGASKIANDGVKWGVLPEDAEVSL